MNIPPILVESLRISKSSLVSQLLATGQLTQYGGMLDDGYYRKGVIKAYSVLTTGQYSGTTAITLNGKTNNHSNNCVLDLNTGLMWSRYVTASVGPNSDGALPWTTNANGEGIFSYCNAANLANLAGYTDWRVPNLFSLVSLEDWEAPDAYPNSVAFPSMGGGIIWCSTTHPGGAVNAMRFTMSTGAFANSAKTNNNKILLVRGG